LETIDVAPMTTAVARIIASGARSAVSARIRAASRAMSYVTGSTRRFAKWRRNASTICVADADPPRNGLTSDSVTVTAETTAPFRPAATNPSMTSEAAGLTDSPPSR
jgi:hypothetical protein